VPYKKIISLVVLWLLVITSPNLLMAANPAESEADTEESCARSTEDQPERNVRKLKNISVFFATMFDLDNSFMFLKDDMFSGNQCLRADLLGLHRAKDQVSDYILDNYRTLTEAELEVQKQLYAQLNGELIFLRNTNQLLNEEKTEYDLSEDSVNAFKRVVEKKIPDSFATSLPLYFNIWMQNYTESFTRYLECPNSWQVVVDRVESIKTIADGVSNSGQAFSEAFTGLGETIADTPGAFWDNSIDTIGSSLLDSYNATRANFNTAIEDINQEFDQLKNDRREFIESYREINQLRFEDLSGGRVAGTGLIDISQSTLDSINRANQNAVTASTSTQIMVESVFNDTSNILILDNLIDLNANLEAINQTFTADGTGLHTLTEEVSTLQCRA
jgi:hypothetical protein